MLLRCLTLLEQHTQTLDLNSPEPVFIASNKKEESEDVIAELVADVCASVSFCLGEIDENGEKSLKRPMAL